MPLHLTLTQTKCGLKICTGDFHFYGINLGIMWTKLKVVVVVVDEVLFNEVSRTGYC